MSQQFCHCPYTNHYLPSLQPWSISISLPGFVPTTADQLQDRCCVCLGFLFQAAHCGKTLVVVQASQGSLPRQWSKPLATDLSIFGQLKQWWIFWLNVRHREIDWYFPISVRLSEIDVFMIFLCSNKWDKHTSWWRQTVLSVTPTPLQFRKVVYLHVSVHGKMEKKTSTSTHQSPMP